jgi:5'-3' exonuclease
VQPDIIIPAVYAKPFQFLRINTLREYLAKEMAQGADYSCVGGFDLERVLDDFVFMVYAEAGV